MAAGLGTPRLDRSGRSRSPSRLAPTLGAPPARRRVRAAPAAAAWGPRRAGGGAAGSGTCWLRKRGGGGLPGPPAAGPRPLPVPRALLGLERRRRPGSCGLQQLPLGPSLVRWARERRAGAPPAAAPAGCAPRLARPPARARAPARPQPRAPPLLPAACPVAGWGPQPSQRAQTGRARLAAARRPGSRLGGMEGSFRIERGKPADPGIPPGTQSLGKSQTSGKLRQVTTGVGKRALMVPKECPVEKPS